MQSIIINQSGLCYAAIRIDQRSQVAFDERTVGSHDYYAIVVDGTVYPLVRVAHVQANPALVDSFNQALVQVEQAVAALQPVEVAPVAEQVIVIADILDQLVIAIEVARINAVIHAVGNLRWLNALETGYNWLLNQDTIIYDQTSHELTVPSATFADRTYTANGACQCQAFEAHQACWHRAASRLVRRALEVPILDTKSKIKRVFSQVEKARINADVAELFA